MAITYSKKFLSASSDGKPVVVEATSSPGTTVHTVQATATTDRENIHLFVGNNEDVTAGTSRQVVIEFAGTGTQDQITVVQSSSDPYTEVIDGWPLTGTGSIIRCYATATGFISIVGYVNRAT